ncbi:uncharacterized protein LOC126897276 [Daktulosphaira vitifoliae]|uniref:uncharacterized protein LOC126897276 n=1 Tax=Daktulosphaira vitifoliae TaxID=58002 RepID=UPI0021AADF62|nr:uncharacterized protein LOC126897276 [Daktulosphaira vitifoliae]
MNIEAYELYAPLTRKDRYKYFKFIIIEGFFLLCTMLPIKLVWMSLMYKKKDSYFKLIFFVLIYFENLIMAIIEWYFVMKCWKLKLMFHKINKNLKELMGIYSNDFRPKDNVYNKNKIKTNWCTRVWRHPSSVKVSSKCIYIESEDMAKIVEKLRIRHQLTREAVSSLIDLFNIPLCLSLCALSIKTLFDIYYEVFKLRTLVYEFKIYIYLWLLQYSYRFYMIVMTTDTTMKQANKSKMLITNLNNRYLNSSVKEELQLFFDQLNNTTMEINACDIIPLNNNLITSAIAAGTTYLVLLLQFN